MFATELVLGQEAETFGARKERKARQRSVTGSSTNTSIGSQSSRSSESTEREQWWSASLKKKAKSIKPKILRPSTSKSTGSQKTISAVTQNLDSQLALHFKDPVLQPSWTYTSSLSSTLPSGDSLHSKDQVSELDGDISSRRTGSTRSRISHDRREVYTPATVDSRDDTAHSQRVSQTSFATSKTRARSATPENDGSLSTPCPGLKSKGSRSVANPAISIAVLNFYRYLPHVVNEEDLKLEALELHDSFQEERTAGEKQRTSTETNSTASNLSCKPFSQWQALTPRGVPAGMQLMPTPRTTPAKVATAHSSTIELTRFQRFIRRMEGAGPKVILDRIKEDWNEMASEEADEELALEKQLWLLTGFQMQNLGRPTITPQSECNTGKILELYGNLSEVYQLSAMHPSQTVHFLTTKPQRPFPLPGNVSYLTVRKFGIVPLPYPEDYFSHIRASTLPSLMPSAKLPEVFSECNKLLAPGGFLEIRIMDAAPVRQTAGPRMRMWIEDRLSINLERDFRCSKPCLLVPGWLADAGFEVVDQANDQNTTLPCAFDPTSATIDQELSTIIGRAFWKDIWGSFVDDVPGEPKWWWEDEEILDECVRRQTLLECKTIFAYKR
ncbi:hypothetical protein PTT_08032 [Pyrenophora teres f. teres 0-1]|uniref:Methyltransferase type 11 domain-containing protein n=1 Tax=Pyrenophora teres f. teres (strain 0-1) TaxID=861557 RepID=E3RIX5_PYRTT|nr:hypothetical protein PTT_08032 [Pyrenophora teres f. teres 0-1]